MLLEIRDGLGDHEAGALVERERTGAGAERRDGDGAGVACSAAARRRASPRRSRRRRRGPGLRERDVDDPAGLEVVAGGDHGFADLDGPLQHGLLLDGLAAGALDGGGDAVVHPELGGRGRDDGVHLELGDVAAGEFELGLAH